MKYQLVVDTHDYNNKKNRFESINFNGESLYSLEEIDSFTTNFKDENDLKYYLKGFHLINPKHLNRIIRITDEKGRIIRNGVAYESSKRYLNIEFICNYFTKNKDNKKIIELLYYSFQNKAESNGHFFSVSCELYNYLKSDFYDQFDNRMIEDIIREYVYSLCNNKNGYYNIHKFGMIINKLERKKVPYQYISYDEYEKQKEDDDLTLLNHYRYLKDTGLLEEELDELLAKEKELLNKLELEYDDEESSTTRHPR